MAIYKKITSYIRANKIKTGIALLVLIGVSYWFFFSAGSSSAQTKYILTQVKKGTVVVSVTGTGQVQTSNQIDIKPKVTGQITWVGVKPGDTVYQGQALMSIDSTTAKRAIATAEQNLATSQLQYQKDQVQAPIDFQKAQSDLVTAKEDLNTTYNDTFNTLSNTYLDLPGVMTVTDSILQGHDISPNGGQWNVDAINSMFTDDKGKAQVVAFSQKATADDTTARTKYDSSIVAYKQLTRSSSQTDIQASLTTSIDTVTAIAQALQSELNMLGVVIDTAQTYNQKLPVAITTLQSTARTNLTTINADLSALLSQKKAIDTATQTITTDEQNIALLQVGNPDGSNPVSLQIEKNNLDTSGQNLEQQKEDLANYTIVAPFSGTISAVDVKVGDNASTGAVASVITNQKIAVVSLNETDVAKVKVGQKATLTFDAVSGLSITGSVAQIDTVGTVTQGVVSYNVQISFDTQDDRIKPGMSVTAAIITDMKQDVLVVPNSSVKTQNGTSYVQMFTPPLADIGGTSGVPSTQVPVEQSVTVGLSDNTNTEIIDGLTEGEQIIARTILPTTKTTTSAPSLIGGGGARAFGGGGVRIGG